MKNNIFYKVVRVIEEGFGSLYLANPQVYSLNKRIDCPYMFVYRPGQLMCEVNSFRALDANYALLKVRAECEPREMCLWLSVSNGIHGGLPDPIAFLLSHRADASEGSVMHCTLLDSLTPIEIVDMSKLEWNAEGFCHIAPAEGEEDGQ